MCEATCQGRLKLECKGYQVRETWEYQYEPHFMETWEHEYEPSFMETWEHEYEPRFMET